MKVCPSCNTVNSNTAGSCQNCNQDIQNVLFVYDEYYDQYFRDLEEIQEEKTKQGKRVRLHVILPAYIVIYTLLFVLAMIFTNHSKNIMATCFAIPLLGYVFPELIYSILYIPRNKDYITSILKGFEPLEDALPPNFIFKFIQCVGYLILLIAFGVMVYFVVT